MPGERSQRNPAWYSRIRSSASAVERRPRSPRPPSTPGSALNRLRSSPAENERPEPRTTTTRTSSASEAPTCASVDQVVGVWALSWSGRSRVTVRTAPSCCVLTQPLVFSGFTRRPRWRSAVACLGLLCLSVRSQAHSRLLTIPVGSTAAAQGGTGLREEPVDEPVRALRGLGQRADALAAVVALAQVVGQRRPVSAGDALALAEMRSVRVGHDIPSVSAAGPRQHRGTAVRVGPGAGSPPLSAAVPVTTASRAHDHPPAGGRPRENGWSDQA